MVNIVISNFFYLGIFFVACKKELATKHNNVLQWIGVLISSVIISAFNIKGPSLVSAFVFLLIFIISGHIFFEASIVKMMVLSVVYFVITMVSELLSSFVVDLIFDLDAQSDLYIHKYSIALFISILLCFLLSNELVSFVCNQFEDDYIPKYVYLVFVLPILTIVLFGNVKDYFSLFNDYKIYVFVLFGLLISNFITIYIFLLSLKSIKWKQKLEISEKEKELLNDKIDLINHDYDNSFIFLHDLLHRCNRLNALVVKNNVKELDKEIQNLYKNCFQKYNMLISNSNALSKVIYLYSSDMIENNITFRSTMEDVEYFNIDNNELISLLSRLLDFAIESCKRVQNERVIVLSSKRVGGSKIMQIKFSSSKNDLDCLHETKIKQIFEKYKVKYDYSFDEEQKLVSLIMLF